MSEPGRTESDVTSEERIAFLAGFFAGACANLGLAPRTAPIIDHICGDLAREWGLEKDRVLEAIDFHWENVKQSAAWALRRGARLQ
jgi:hypothetical protein